MLNRDEPLKADLPTIAEGRPSVVTVQSSAKSAYDMACNTLFSPDARHAIRNMAMHCLWHNKPINMDHSVKGETTMSCGDLTLVLDTTPPAKVKSFVDSSPKNPLPLKIDPVIAAAFNPTGNNADMSEADVPSIALGESFIKKHTFDALHAGVDGSMKSAVRGMYRDECGQELTKVEWKEAIDGATLTIPSDYGFPLVDSCDTPNPTPFFVNASKYKLSDEDKAALQKALVESSYKGIIYLPNTELPSMGLRYRHFDPSRDSARAWINDKAKEFMSNNMNFATWGRLIEAAASLGLPPDFFGTECQNILDGTAEKPLLRRVVNHAAREILKRSNGHKSPSKIYVNDWTMQQLCNCGEITEYRKQCAYGWVGDPWDGDGKKMYCGLEFEVVGDLQDGQMVIGGNKESFFVGNIFCGLRSRFVDSEGQRQEYQYPTSTSAVYPDYERGGFASFPNDKARQEYIASQKDQAATKPKAIEIGFVVGDRVRINDKAWEAARGKVGTIKRIDGPRVGVQAEDDIGGDLYWPEAEMLDRLPVNPTCGFTGHKKSHCDCETPTPLPEKAVCHFPGLPPAESDRADGLMHESTILAEMLDRLPVNPTCGFTGHKKSHCDCETPTPLPEKNAMMAKHDQLKAARDREPAKGQEPLDFVHIGEGVMVPVYDAALLDRVKKAQANTVLPLSINSLKASIDNHLADLLDGAEPECDSPIEIQSKE